VLCNGKVGADDFILAHGPDRFRDLVDKATVIQKRLTPCRKSSLPPELLQKISRAIHGTDEASIAAELQVDEFATLADAAKLVDDVCFLVRDWVPQSMVTGVIGEPGKGKSAFVLYGLVRPVVLGCEWFNGRLGPSKPGKVLWCGTEYDMAITIKRTRDWGIPMEQVVLPFADDPLAAVNLEDESHQERIESLIKQHQTRLVVVDSLRGSHDGDENNSRVGRILQTLSGIAERTGAAVAVVHHTKKLAPDEEMTANSARGSNAILALFRSQIGVDEPDRESKWVRLRILKENLGIAPEPIGMLVTKEGVEFGNAPEKPKKVTREDEAAQFLRTRMKRGKWYAAKDVIEDATQQGFSEGSLHRAKTAIGIVKPDHLKREENQWFWKLP
jgi:RecA-family ATPase